MAVPDLISLTALGPQVMSAGTSYCLTRNDGRIVDIVSFSSDGTSPCGRGTPLLPIGAGNNRAGYRRRDGCVDTEDPNSNFVRDDFDTFLSSQSPNVPCVLACDPMEPPALPCCNGIRLPRRLELYLVGTTVPASLQACPWLQLTLPAAPVAPTQTLWWDARVARWRTLDAFGISTATAPVAGNSYLNVPAGERPPPPQAGGKPVLGAEFWFDGTDFVLQITGCAAGSNTITAQGTCAPFLFQPLLYPFAGCYKLGAVQAYITTPPGFDEACSLVETLPRTLQVTISSPAGGNCGCVTGPQTLSWQPIQRRWFGQATFATCSPPVTISMEFSCGSSGLQFIVMVTKSSVTTSATTTFTAGYHLCRTPFPRTVTFAAGSAIAVAACSNALDPLTFLIQ